MGKQVYAETVAWNSRRVLLQQQLAAAFTSGDFSGCQTVQYADLDPGQYGFPTSSAMEQLVINGYTNAGSASTAVGDIISIMMQVNVLESFRRSYLSTKQTRRDFVAHQLQTNVQTPLYNDLMLQQFVSVDKNLDLPTS